MKCTACRGAGWYKATTPDGIVEFCRLCFGSGLTCTAPRLHPAWLARIGRAVRNWL